MMGHFSVEMTNFDEQNPDDLEWRKAAPELDLKANIKF